MRAAMTFVLHLTAFLVGGLAVAGILDPHFGDVLLAFLQTTNGYLVGVGVAVVFVLCPLAVFLRWWQVFRRAREISYTTEAGRISVSLIAVEEALTRAIEGESDVKKATVRVFEDRVKRSIMIEAVVTLWEVANVTERNRFCQRLLRRRFAELMPEQTVVQVNLTVHRLNQRRDEPRPVKPPAPAPAVITTGTANDPAGEHRQGDANPDFNRAPPIGVEYATSEEDLYVGPSYPVLRDEEEGDSGTQFYPRPPPAAGTPKKKR
jgi:hypothetical protein